MLEVGRHFGVVTFDSPARLRLRRMVILWSLYQPLMRASSKRKTRIRTSASLSLR